MLEVSKTARLNVLRVANRVGGVHFGGIFSLIDFLAAYYLRYGVPYSSMNLENSVGPDLLISKGHCYLAQLAVVDAINNNTDHCDMYLRDGSTYYGHPKRLANNDLFKVSSGSLGQGLVMSQGIALAKKLKEKTDKTWCVIGDGELNEGACQEALTFASQHQLEVVIVLDNNKQESLDFTENILGNGDLMVRISSLKMQYINVDGHNISDLNLAMTQIDNTFGPVFLNLDTIKGKGVSFMEKVTKWHSTRLRDNQYDLACRELREP